MANKKLDDKEALAAAIEMEEKGIKFFKESAQKSKDNMAKEVFEFLAGEEVKHIDAIRAFNKNYLAGKKSNMEKLIEGMKASKGPSPIDILFKGLDKKAPTSGSDLEVYRFAQDFERRGEQFYRKAESEAKDPNAKKLYGFLIGEEKKHFKIVESCLLYFENPEEFFHQREKWHVEG